MLATLTELTKQIIDFREKRNWKQFHTPKNLATSISIEANELLEIFQWAEKEDLEKLTTEKREEIKKEIADVAIYLLYLSNDLNIDILEAIEEKIKHNKEKYPVDKSINNSKKYTEL